MVFTVLWCHKHSLKQEGNPEGHQLDVPSVIAEYSCLLRFCRPLGDLIWYCLGEDASDSSLEDLHSESVEGLPDLLT